MTNSIISVSDLLRSIKITLELNENLKVFWVKGEISNFTAHRSGHWYFSLKDENSKIACVMFQGYTKEVNFSPKDGDQVLLRASVTVYPAQGSVQCSVFAMQNLGIGNLYLAYERLKLKLQQEGLFNVETKKPIPRYPDKVAVITGRKTAALQDILKTFHLRWPMIQLEIYESLVQGAEAPQNIINALIKADSSNVDCIVLARGGGSIEDLWAFNDEGLARCIHSLKTPLVTGIGHESDTTIADLVADFRAATPTAAVQKVVRDYHEVREELKHIQDRIKQFIEYRLQTQQQRFDYLSQPLTKESILTYMEERSTRLTLIKHRLSQTSQRFSIHKTQLVHVLNDLRHWVNVKQLDLSHQLSTQSNDLKRALQISRDHRHTQFSTILNLLQAYSPLKRLESGYTLSYQNQRLIKSIGDVDLEQELTIRFNDGLVRTQPIGKEPL